METGATCRNIYCCEVVPLFGISGEEDSDLITINVIFFSVAVVVQGHAAVKIVLREFPTAR